MRRSGLVHCRIEQSVRGTASLHCHCAWVAAMGTGGYVVGWGTLSLINAGIAQGKGQSGLLWWLVSLVLGTIATFMLVALTPVSADRHKRP